MNAKRDVRSFIYRLTWSNFSYLRTRDKPRAPIRRVIA